jgi:hypothetical protein
MRLKQAASVAGRLIFEPQIQGVDVMSSANSSPAAEGRSPPPVRCTTVKKCSYKSELAVTLAALKLHVQSVSYRMCPSGQEQEPWMNAAVHSVATTAGIPLRLVTEATSRFTSKCLGHHRSYSCDRVCGGPSRISTATLLDESASTLVRWSCYWHAAWS